MRAFCVSLVALTLPVCSMAQGLGARCQELQIKKSEASEAYRRARTGQGLAPAAQVPASCEVGMRERDAALDRELAAYRAFEACKAQG